MLLQSGRWVIAIQDYEMPKRVLDVGNCSFDHGSIKSLVEDNFDAVVVQANDADEASRQLAGSGFDLVLVNRVFDRNGASGLDLIRELASHVDSSAPPVMLVTNFDDYQDQAVQLGAIRGFGKSELKDRATLDKLGVYLS